MSDFEIWIYRGAIVILLAILWYLAKGVLAELKKINNTLSHHSENNIRIEDRLKVNEESVIDLTKRMRDAERKQDSCQFCKES